jgi:peptidyl-dipeptidase A
VFEREAYVLRVTNELPPADATARERLVHTRVAMSNVYVTGACDAAGSCKDAQAINDAMHGANTADELGAAWRAWYEGGIGRKVKADFTTYVALANQGARDAGFADVGAQWRSAYDMPPDDFARDTEHLWSQIEPLYRQLHCYVRRKLRAKYGDAVPAHGLIPMQLTRNLWSLNWDALWPEVEPYPDVAPIDVTSALVAQHVDADHMVRIGEAFFTSLGMAPLPATFWERSVLTPGLGKKMQCPGERIWSVDDPADIRMTMCTAPTHEDLWIIHHELGHAHYRWAMRELPPLLQAAANPGFDEASGDVLQLSMTPRYLHAIGLLPAAEQSREVQINALMHMALNKVAFLPYGYLIDRWRWDVFAGRIAPADYNTSWWQLVARYQGVAPPVARAADEFDPGAAVFHVVGDIPYISYFIAGIVEFQLHRALCKKAGFTGPASECSIYGSKAAGAAYERFFRHGAAQRWQDSFAELSGESTIDASALVEYFAPLSAWLEEQNRSEACGW